MNRIDEKFSELKGKNEHTPFGEFPPTHSPKHRPPGPITSLRER